MAAAIVNNKQTNITHEENKLHYEASNGENMDRIDCHRMPMADKPNFSPAI